MTQRFQKAQNKINIGKCVERVELLGLLIVYHRMCSFKIICWLQLVLVYIVLVSGDSCSVKGFNSKSLPCELCSAIQIEQVAKDCQSELVFLIRISN